MALSLSFVTTEKISPALQAEINAAADLLYARYSWVFCDGPSLRNRDGFLEGTSKLCMSPHPDEAADARSEGQPDGSFGKLLDCLCSVSRQFDLDWTVNHDHDGPFHIRCGHSDSALREFCEAFGDIADDFPDGV